MEIISSFSGGRTSAYMTIRLKEQYPDLIPIFANTSQENNETLDFINKCDKEFNLNVVWLEAKINSEHGKGTRYKIINYQNAHRKGKVFEEMIKKYGIPNPAYLHCTRELKLSPIQAWIKDNIKDDHKMAVGIRLDEQVRVSKDAVNNHLFYPLIDWQIIKQKINEFWRYQKFKLEIDDYQGNCKVCFKKGERKLLIIAKENPDFFDFNLKMEKYHGLSGHNVDGNKRVFFRNNMSASQLIEKSKTNIIDMMDFVDTGYYSPCSESCEAFTDI